MKTFWAFARQHFHATAIYRLDFWLRVASTPILMYGMRSIWTTLYTQRPGAFGISLQQMVTYAGVEYSDRKPFLYRTAILHRSTGQVRRDRWRLVETVGFSFPHVGAQHG